ncbi:MAG TPA: hypothetical protein VM689_25810 [Aliidongia sp.]|nr:hypothetical protein [Aliidongia sp.]
MQSTSFNPLDGSASALGGMYRPPPMIELTGNRAARTRQYFLLATLIIANTFLQKFGIPISSDSSLSVGLVLMALVTGLGIVMGELQIHSRNLMLYLLLATTLLATQILGGQDFSKPSLALLLCIHLPYIFHFKRPMSDPLAPMRIYQHMMLLIALFGIGQFAIQFVIGWEKAFILDTAVPKQFLEQGYNALNPVGSSGHIFRANGFFMLEASLLSQTVAIAVIIELMHFRRPAYLLAFAAALIVSYSGTGLIILAVVTPIVLAKRGRLDAIFLLGAAAAVLIVFASELQLSIFVNRLDEFSNVRSSGFARFLSIFYLINDYMLPDLGSALFGLGSGAITHMANLTYYKIHDPSWGKLVFEYGFVGALVYFPCMGRIVFGTKQHAMIKLALVIQFLVLGGYLLTPIVHVLFLALVVWPFSGESVPDRSASALEPAEIERSLPPRRARQAVS